MPGRCKVLCIGRAFHEAQVFEILFALTLTQHHREAARWEQQLASENWRVRVTAASRLYRSGDLGTSRRLASTAKDPEVRWRAREVYLRLRGDILHSMQPYPRLNALWYDPNAGYGGQGEYDYNSETAWRLMRHVDSAWHIGFNGKQSALTNEQYIDGTGRWLAAEIDRGVLVWSLRLKVWDMALKDNLALKLGHKTPPSDVKGR